MKKIKNDTYEVYRLGSIFGHTGGSFAGLVYDPNGIAPTVNTAQGGLRMPLIIEVRNDRDKRRNNKDKGSNI